jgi:hypothetical protein
MKIHQGMNSDAVLQLFGDPKNISSAVCGKSPNQWNCTTWTYGKSSYANASFTFSGKHGSYTLNNFYQFREEACFFMRWSEYEYFRK